MGKQKDRSKNEQDDFHRRVKGAMGRDRGIQRDRTEVLTERITGKKKFKKLPDSFTKPIRKTVQPRLEKKFTKKKKPVDRTSKEFKEKRIRIITGEKDK